MLVKEEGGRVRVQTLQPGLEAAGVLQPIRSLAETSQPKGS